MRNSGKTLSRAGTRSPSIWSNAAKTRSLEVICSDMLNPIQREMLLIDVFYDSSGNALEGAGERSFCVDVQAPAKYVSPTLLR
jgi:hypothetical protein